MLTGRITTEVFIENKRNRVMAVEKSLKSRCQIWIDNFDDSFQDIWKLNIGREEKGDKTTEL